jgi:tryptophan halogenase
LQKSDLDPRPACVGLFNEATARVWDSIRRFLATHYRFNTRLDTPFWRYCREHVDLAGAEPIVEWYQEFGPTPYAAPVTVDRLDVFGIDGYLTTLLGQAVPHRSKFVPSEAERSRWAALREEHRARARRALTVAETFERLQHGPVGSSRAPSTAAVAAMPA